MNNVVSDPTVSFALVVTLCALFSAPLTALINNIFQLLLRNMELKSEERKYRFRTLFENKIGAYKAFIEAVSHNRGGGSFRKDSAAISATQSAILLCDKETLALLLRLQSLNPQDVQSYDEAVFDISQSFNRELTQLSATK